MYAALEFDHALFKPQIKWIVVQCAGVGHKCGGPIALPPRHDVAYFVNPNTAREDAEAFADLKNRQADGRLNDSERNMVEGAAHGATPKRHLAYPWDHQLMAEKPLRWGVLEWSGHEEVAAPRIDIAYFTDPATAETDAKLFALMRG
jgi:hypothetical protein